MKTFLLGVGAQKSATSWLYDYLKMHEQCDLGFNKEYHVFDALFVPDRGLRNLIVNRLNAVQKLAALKIKDINNETLELDLKLERAIKAVSFDLNTENYASYFDQLHRANPKTALVGDITPSYSMLSADNYSYIKELLERRGFKVKVIFLMRDPIERAYSEARMHLRDLKVAGKATKKMAEVVMNNRLGVAGLCNRGQYDMTIKSLEQVFDVNDIHYGFYETLFHEKEVRKITDFLGIDFIDADFGKKVNASPRPAELSHDSINQALQRFDGVYDFCKTKFGEKFIDRIWPVPNV